MKPFPSIFYIVVFKDHLQYNGCAYKMIINE